jgi:hypothetical protein
MRDDRGNVEGPASPPSCRKSEILGLGPGWRWQTNRGILELSSKQGDLEMIKGSREDDE